MLKDASAKMSSSHASMAQNMQKLGRIFEGLGTLHPLDVAFLVQTAKKLPETQELAMRLELTLFPWFHLSMLKYDWMMQHCFYRTLTSPTECFRIVKAFIASYKEFLEVRDMLTTYTSRTLW